MKVVVNRCYGGFSLSQKACEMLGLEEDSYGYEYEYDRANPELVRVVEELGSEANGAYASLKVIEIPDGVNWEIEQYDGYETVSEVHRSW